MKKRSMAEVEGGIGGHETDDRKVKGIEKSG